MTPAKRGCWGREQVPFEGQDIQSTDDADLAMQIVARKSWELFDRGNAFLE